QINHCRSPRKECDMPLGQKKTKSDSTVPQLQDAIRQHIKYNLGKDEADLSRRELFQSLALAVRDRAIDRLLETEKRYQQADAKRLYYLSLEFLIGRSLGNNLVNLGLDGAGREVLQKLGADLDELQESEPDAALGN